MYIIIYIYIYIIDTACEDKEGSLYVLLLDWSKALDRVKPQALIVALQRFGVPPDMVRMIGAIYDQRTFHTCDFQHESRDHGQTAGIAQGCPLSPYLFIIMMSVVARDVQESLLASEGAARQKRYIVSRDTYYADDTTLVSSTRTGIEKHLALVAAAGRQYGLELNLKKTVLLSVGAASGTITLPDGSTITAVQQAVYLGGLLGSDGRPSGELSRRLGEAGRLFDTLSAIWKHANITRQRKIQVFDACVVSKLLYSLESLWLLQEDRKKLDMASTQNASERSLA